jgi:hypothetical protein
LNPFLSKKTNAISANRYETTKTPVLQGGTGCIEVEEIRGRAMCSDVTRYDAAQCVVHAERIVRFDCSTASDENAEVAR